MINLQVKTEKHKALEDKINTVYTTIGFLIKKQ